MKQGLGGFLHYILISLSLAGLLACSSASGPHEAAVVDVASPRGFIGGAAAPGMEQDAGSANTDMQDIKLQLTCIPGSYKNLKINDNAGGVEDGIGFTGVHTFSAIGTTFTLKLSFYSMSQRVLRIVDVDRQEYKQVVTNSLGDARTEWTKKISQNVEFYSSTLASGEAHTDFKPCQNNCSETSELKHLTPCQRFDSCTPFGFNYQVCEHVEFPEDDVVIPPEPI